MSDPIKIAEFNELILFQAPVRTKSTKGQMKETWSDYRKAIVKIDRSNMDERLQGDRINLPGNLLITGHYDSGLTTKHRISFESEYYNILSIEPLQARRFMRLNATKIFD